jgi:hypothetical protein
MVRPQTREPGALQAQKQQAHIASGERHCKGGEPRERLGGGNIRCSSRLTSPIVPAQRAAKIPTSFSALGLLYWNRSA